MTDDSTAEKATVAGNSVLDDWFRHVGTQLSDEDYEAGIKAIASRDTEVAELRGQLAEAQATIATTLEFVAAIDPKRHAGHLALLRGKIIEHLEGGLSAPSSTGGN